MKLKSLLFGSAAVIAAGTGAQAADLPIVEPVEYVRICDAFGAGFYYIPGTDTCLKIGGYVRVESHYVFGDDSDSDLTARFGTDADFNNYSTRVRGHVNFDARTQTDFGLVRAYIAMEITRGPTDDIGTTGLEPDGTYGNSANLASAFIQISNDWGTYTAGRTGSFFDFWGGESWGTRIGLEAGTEDTTLFAWTFAGGNGFSFTLAAEDPLSNGRIHNGDDDYGGREFPDGVANIRVDQGWGSAQIMGAVRHFNDDGDDSDIGWAVGAGLSIGIPGGWALNAQGGYTEGMLAYISSDPSGMGDFGDGEANESWAVRAGISGPITSNINAWLEGQYVDAEEGDGSTDYQFWSVVAGAAWSPVPGLYMGPEFAYNSNDEGESDADITDDYDVFGIMWRVQRSF